MAILALSLRLIPTRKITPISKLIIKLSRGLLGRENLESLFRQIHSIQKGIISFIKEHRTIKLLHIFRNYSALIVVISSAVLVSATNLSAGKESSGFLFGYLGSTEDNYANPLENKLFIETDKKKGLAMVPLAEAKTAPDPELKPEDSNQIAIENEAFIIGNSPVREEPKEEGEHREEVAAALWPALLELDGWSSADLRGLAEDRDWVALLRDAAEQAGLGVMEDADQNGVAPFLELPDTWDVYLGGPPWKLRHEIKRKAKKLEAETGPFRIVRADEETVVPMLDRFVELHRTSEGPKGVFMVPHMEIFFRRLGEAFCADGVFRLTMIEVAGELAAGTIGFSFDRTTYLYNSAFDRRWAVLAPGMVLVAEDIRLAIEDGCEGFDLLKGDYQYKYRFGSVPRRVRRLVVTRSCVGWCHLTIPTIVYWNTLVLVGASAAMQAASSAVSRGGRRAAQIALTTAGALSIGFLAGQVLAWQFVGPSLYFIQGSPAIAFFYVLTVVHGLHLAGGLFVLGRASLRFVGGAELIDLRQSFSLCAVYWHFLLLVLLAVFGALVFL